MKRKYLAHQQQFILFLAKKEKSATKFKNKKKFTQKLNFKKYITTITQHIKINQNTSFTIFK